MNILPKGHPLSGDANSLEHSGAPHTQPIVSVVIPVYNKADYLEDALRSTFSQSLQNIEVVIVDDGSVDESLDVARRHAADDSRVVVLAQENAGVAAARNRGVAAARGQYVAFLDPDDWYPDLDVLRDLVEAAEANDVPIAGGSAVKFAKGSLTSEYPANESGYRFQSDEVLKYANYQFDYGFWRFIYRRSFLIDNGILFPPYRRYQDPPFFVRAMSISGRFAALSRPSYVYRVAATTNWAPERIVDVLRGMVDVLKIAAESDFHDLASRTIRRFNFPHIQSALGAMLENDAERVLPLLETMSRLAVSVGTIWTEPALSRRETIPSEEGGAHIDVSVIVPVYNASAWLHECLLSVLGQTGVRVEVVCVDDGSTDDSMRILREYEALDARIRIVQQQNGGLSVARNTGLSVARGRYVCFLDSDDYYRVDAVSALVSRCDEDELDVVQFDAVAFADPGVSEASWRQYSTYYRRSVERPEVVSGPELVAAQMTSKDYKPSACLYMVRTAHLKRNQIRFIPGMTHEDNPFTFAVFLNATRAAHVSLDLHARRVRPSSIMTSNSIEASMRGYFISYLEMTREAARHSFPPEISRVLGDHIFRIFTNVSARLTKLDHAGVDALRELVSTPDGEVAFATLDRLHRDSQKYANAAKA